ncbi:MAG TPA: S8 family serine peptidase [Mycobacteriales bacterium]|nr:S8 family serine peptidase [Mycobacteriales bacterium]
MTKPVRSRLAGAVAAVLGVAALAGAVPARATNAPVTRVIITTADDQAAATLARDLRRQGVQTMRALPLVHGYAAEVPTRGLAALRRNPIVRSVTPDASVRLHAADPALGYDVASDFGSLYNITKIVGARDSWVAGYTGKGIGVALLDSGVSPVQGLTSGNVVNGADLSFESQSTELIHRDTFGHGTHMASIIAGRDVVRSNPASYDKQTADFTGVAPDARIISVKVADHSGASDVSQVIAGIDWIVEHAQDPGLNVRVLNLSFGTDSTQAWKLDPLSYAAENAWKQGLVVVVAGGNNGDAGSLTNPAINPWVIAVGADDPRDTLTLSDDVVPPFSSRGSERRSVDVLAPGMHVLGLRNPGSAADQAYPSARVGERFFRGTGTSQSAAVVSGAAALLLQRYPSMTPDQVKRQLTSTAGEISTSSPRDRDGTNAGVVNVRKAQQGSQPRNTQAHEAGTGTGSLDAARGSYHLERDGVVLDGERDIFGTAFDSAAWAAATSRQAAWDGGSWLGNAWSGNGWSSSDWTGNAWSGNAWSGNAWSGNGWSDESWSGHAWSGNGWSGNAWSASAWEGHAWSDAGWSGHAWSASSWS